jgi:hypothetical protein
MTPGLSFLDALKRATERAHLDPFESYMLETPVVDI